MADKGKLIRIEVDDEVVKKLVEVEERRKLFIAYSYRDYFSKRQLDKFFTFSEGKLATISNHTKDFIKRKLAIKSEEMYTRFAGYEFGIQENLAKEVHSGIWDNDKSKWLIVDLEMLDLYESTQEYSKIVKETVYKIKDGRAIEKKTANSFLEKLNEGNILQVAMKKADTQHVAKTINSILGHLDAEKSISVQYSSTLNRITLAIKVAELIIANDITTANELMKTSYVKKEKTWEAFFKEFFDLLFPTDQNLKKSIRLGDLVSSEKEPDLFVVDSFGAPLLIELKTHEPFLFEFEGHKKFFPSKELSKAVSQVHNYSRALILSNNEEVLKEKGVNLLHKGFIQNLVIIGQDSTLYKDLSEKEFASLKKLYSDEGNTISDENLKIEIKKMAEMEFVSYNYNFKNTKIVTYTYFINKLKEAKKNIEAIVLNYINSKQSKRTKRSY